MTRLSLIALSVLSLSLTVPAMAKKPHHARATTPAVVAVTNPDPNLPVENALRWGYSQGYSYYPSGYGGLYGDGRYPGNVISNGSQYGRP